MKKVMGKRGQVTTFIILGIVMLLAVIFFFYMRADITKITYDEKVPEGFIPLQRFVEQCMGDETTQLVQLAGQQGGYVDVPTQIKANPFSRVVLVPQLDIVTPYWYYRKGGNVEDGDLSPSEDVMERQIKENADRKITECIDSFNAFSNLYNIIDNGTVDTTIMLTDNSVVVLADFPIKVQDSTGQIFEMKRFRKEIPIRLRKAYELAQDLFDAENDQMFLEDVTIDLLAMASKGTDRYDGTPYVPMSDMIFGQCRPFMKSLNRVKQNIKDMLPFNLDSIRINETKQEAYIHPDYDYANKHFVWKSGIDRDKYEDIRVEIDYDPSWMMKLRVIPSENGFLKAETVKIIDLDLGITRLTIPACFVNYHFVYDLEYPVIVKIFDEHKTNEHDAYVFQFAMPVIINHNEGDKINTPVKLLPDSVLPGGEHQFCSETSDKIIVSASDEVTYEPINDVDIRFSCIEFTCDMGRTTPQLTTYSLETYFPRCNYGTIIAEKDGYFMKEIRGVDTEVDSFVDFYMLRKKKLNLTISKYLKGDVLRRLISDDESVLVDIRNEEYGRQTSAFYSNNVPFNEIELPAGGDMEFEIEAMLIRNDSIIGGSRFTWVADAVDLINADELEIAVAVNESLVGDYEAQLIMIDNLDEFSEGLDEPMLK